MKLTREVVMPRILLSYACCLFLHASCFAQTGQQERLFEESLAKLAIEFDLDDEQIEIVRCGCVKPLQVAARYWKQSPFTNPGWIDRATLRQAFETLKVIANRDKVQLMVEAQERIWRTYDQNSQALFVAVISRHLRMSHRQRLQLLNYFGEIWDDRWNHSVGLSLFNGLDSAREVLNEIRIDQWKPLSEEQQVGLRRFDEMAFSLNHALNPGLDWRIGFRSEAEQETRLEIDRLRRLLDLDESQIASLQVGAKGAMVKAIAHRSHTDFDVRDVTDLAYVMESAFDQLASHGVWQTVLEKCLTEDQYRNWEKQERLRDAWRNRVAAFAATKSYCDKVGATFSERQGVFNLALEKIESAKNEKLTLCEQSFLLGRATDEEILAVVSAELFSQREGVLRKLRIRLLDMDQAIDK